MRRELVIAIAACVMAIAVIIVVKKFLVYLGTAASDKEVILLLEFGAVVLVFASFVLSEFLRAFRYILTLMQGKRISDKTDLRPVIILLMTIIVSLAIYFSFAKLAAQQ